jgi:hypothetical protein
MVRHTHPAKCEEEIFSAGRGDIAVQQFFATSFAETGRTGGKMGSIYDAA